MKTVVVTGSRGFIGQNLCAAIRQVGGYNVREYDQGDSWDYLSSQVQDVDCVVHLAGVNRPSDPSEFDTGNRLLTENLLRLISGVRRPVTLVFASSIQAVLDNPYGRSKRAAEEAIFAWAGRTGNPAFVYRLPNVFGKWCRPNYNSVVATFCHNVARGTPIEVRDPEAVVTLVYIDDVVAELLSAIEGHPTKGDDGFCTVPRVFRKTVQQLADTITGFAESRRNLVIPDFHDEFTRFLYATFVSYLPENEIVMDLDMKTDSRGWLAEFIKSENAGQIFLSRTKPGVTRGNHWHHTKVEKFLLIEGQAVIRLRRLGSDKVIEIPVSGDRMTVVDIPPGYTHSITNVGTGDLVTLFWADEIFDPDRPDTYREEV